MYQDVPRGNLPTGAKVGFGLRTWAGQAATVRLTVHQMGAGGVLQSHTKNVQVGTSRRRSEGEFTLLAQTEKLRYEVYLKSPNINIHLDDAWLSEN